MRSVFTQVLGTLACQAAQMLMDSVGECMELYVHRLFSFVRYYCGCASPVHSSFLLSKNVLNQPLTEE